MNRILYNDYDPKCCAWISELVKAGEIPNGDVLCKSITEINPDELKPYIQFHAFCGIAGWAYALKLAGWPTNRNVWSASLPCQSFSLAGNGKGFADPRGQLWEPFFNLVRARRPITILGEQVEAAIGKGWLDRVFGDLESEGYTCGAVVLGAHSIQAPHIRQRLFWVADRASRGLRADGGAPRQPGYVEQRDQAGGLANSNERANIGGESRIDKPSGANGLREDVRRLQHSKQPGLEGHPGNGANGGEPGRIGEGSSGSVAATGRGNFWDASRWHYCLDKKYRRVPLESEIFPLAPGLPARVGLLRGAGNSIVAPLAAQFIKAYLEVISTA